MIAEHSLRKNLHKHILPVYSRTWAFPHIFFKTHESLSSTTNIDKATVASPYKKLEKQFNLEIDIAGIGEFVGDGIKNCSLYFYQRWFSSNQHYSALLFFFQNLYFDEDNQTERFIPNLSKLCWALQKLENIVWLIVI